MAVLEKYRDEEQLERDKKKKEQETSKTPPASAEISQGPLLLHNSKLRMSPKMHIYEEALEHCVKKMLILIDVPAGHFSGLST